MWTGVAAFGRRFVLRLFDIEPAARSWTRYGGGIRELTVKRLNAECKLPGLRKYSMPNKAELTSLLEADRPPRGRDSKANGIGNNVLAVKELKAKYKPREQRNYSELDEAELISLPNDKPRGGKDAPPPVERENREKEKTAYKEKWWNSRKHGPLQPIAQTEIDDGPTDKDKPGFIYVYSEPGSSENEWKVGRTTKRPPENRMNTAARTNGTTYELKEYWPVPFNRYAERVAHAELREYNVPRKVTAGRRGWADGGSEWFKVDYEFLEARIRVVLEATSTPYQ